MDEQIRQIAERLKGLRESLDLSMDQAAADCGLSEAEYKALESGECDPSVSLLQRIAHQYGITLDELMFGEEPKMKSYFLTRKGTGISVERSKAYKYELLAAGFIGRKADPFIVTVEPKPQGTPLHFNTHEGQEFHLVMEGRILVNISGKEWTLNPGDSLFFDSGKPHAFLALDGKPAKFLAMVMQ